MAIAAPRSQTEAPTQETGTLPRIPDRERRRASFTMPRLAPGRYLAIEDGDEVVLLPLAADLMHIGRSPSADIVLDDASVSRRHALVARRGERTVILDDRSLNGVTVNGEARVRGRAARRRHGRRRARAVALRRAHVAYPRSGGFGPAGPDRHLDWFDGATHEDHTRVVFISLLLAGMAFALSQTVVSPALPEIQREYGADAGVGARGSSPATCSPPRWRRRSSASSATSSAAVEGADDRAARLRRRQRRLRARAVARRARRGPGHPGRRRRDLPARVRDHPRDVPARARRRRRSAGSARRSASAAASGS